MSSFLERTNTEFGQLSSTVCHQVSPFFPSVHIHKKVRCQKITKNECSDFVILCCANKSVCNFSGNYIIC